MEISESAEEALEAMWTYAEREGNDLIDLNRLEVNRDDGTLKELSKLGLITVSGDQVKLTSRGRDEAESIVRRHRLAERLLFDVLDTDINFIEHPACKFEHILRNGIDENICTLLGHPKLCPHGNPIPIGRCCRKNMNMVSKIVSPLSSLKPGQGGKIAYIQSRRQKILQRFIALSVLPGMPITLVQKFPSYIFQVGQTQFAVDKELADEIFVLVTEK